MMSARHLLLNAAASAGLRLPASPPSAYDVIGLLFTVQFLLLSTYIRTYTYSSRAKEKETGKNEIIRYHHSSHLYINILGLRQQLRDCVIDVKQWCAFSHDCSMTPAIGL